MNARMRHTAAVDLEGYDILGQAPGNAPPGDGRRAGRPGGQRAPGRGSRLRTAVIAAAAVSNT